MTSDTGNQGLLGKDVSSRTEELLAQEIEKANYAEKKAKMGVKEKQAEKRRIDSQLKRFRKQAKELATHKRHLAKLLKGLKARSSTDFLLAYRRVYSKRLPAELAKVPGLSQALKEDKRRYEDKVREIKLNFAQAFHALCNENGLTPISGDVINGFRVRGWFKVTPNWEIARTSVTTVNKGHTVTIKSLDPEEIAKSLCEIADKLFLRPFSAHDFMSVLFNAYKSVAGKLGADALLSKLADRINMNTEEFAIDLAKLLASGCKATPDGYVMSLSPGEKGIIVYNKAGGFRTYKFIRFSKEA